MTQHSITKNYSAAGSAIMEMIYGDDYLSPGGIPSTETLAELGNLTHSQRILDIGSGIGGAAFHLAAKRNCKVQGIDLIESNVLVANRRASERGLSDRVNFVCADATALPFASDSFDIVWGQEAWCHVEDKETLMSESARVLVGGGKLVFSDWLLSDPASPDNEEARSVTASPNMGDLESYLQLMQNERFTLESYVDGSEVFILRYQEVLKKLVSMEAKICQEFGVKVFEIVLSKQKFVLQAFQNETMVFGSFVASTNDMLGSRCH